MKVKVISIFVDKNTNERYELNKVLDNISEERYEEIKEFVKIIENTKKKGTVVVPPLFLYKEEL